jgi:hypothetical protein
MQLQSTTLTNPSPLMALINSQASLLPLRLSLLSKLMATSFITSLFLLPPLGTTTLSLVRSSSPRLILSLRSVIKLLNGLRTYP